MRRMTFKISAVVILAITTSFVTSKVVAQQKKLRQRVSNSIATVKQVPVGKTGGSAITNQSQPGAEPRIAGTMKRISVQRVHNQPDLVELKAAAHIKDLRPGIKYVWYVKVFDPSAFNRSPVLQHIYENNILTPGDDFVITAEFHEFIEVKIPFKQYEFDVSLYEINDTHGLAGVSDPNLQRTLQGPRGWARMMAGGG